MSDLHIDDFFKDVARILLRLYASFPRPTQLFVEEIIGPDKPDEFGLHSNRHMACFSTMLWLAAEGYLRYEASIRQEVLDQVVLTAPCLLRLCLPNTTATPTSAANGTPVAGVLELEQQSHAHLLRSAVKAHSSGAIRLAVMQFLTTNPDDTAVRPRNP